MLKMFRRLPIAMSIIAAAVAAAYDPYLPSTVLEIHGGNEYSLVCDDVNNTITNNGVISADSTNGKCAAFNGSANLSASYSSKFDWWKSSYTIEAWVKADSWNNWSYLDTFQQPVLIGNASQTSGANYWSFGPTSNGSVAFYYWNGAQNRIATVSTLTTGTWHHIALTVTGTTIKIYLDGVLSATGTINGTPLSGAEQPLTIGKINNKSIVGSVRDLRITNGINRYTANFEAPVSTFYDYRAADYYWDNTTTLLPLNGNVTDAKGNSVTNTGITFSNTYPLFGSDASACWDGLARSLQIPATASISGTDDFTVEFWIVPINFGSGYKVLVANNTAGGLSMLINASGTLSFGKSLTSIDGTTSNAVTFNTWNHVAISRIAGVLKFFINGSQGYSGSNSTNFASGVIRIGIDGDGTSYPFYGYMREFRVTRGVGRYKANFSVPNAAHPNYGASGPTSDPYLKYTNVLISGNTLTPELGPALISNTGVVVSSTKSKTYPNSLYFNGNHVVLPSGSYFEPLGNDFTVEFWYNTDVPATRQWFFHSGADWWLGLDLWNSKLGIWASSNGASWDLINSEIGTGNGNGTTIIQANTWYHIALVRKDNAVKLYLNGVLEKSVTVTGAIVDRSGLPKIVGNHSSGTAPVRGHIQDFRFTKNAARYLGNFIPPAYRLPIAA